MTTLPPPPDDPEAALNRTAGTIGPSWSEAEDLVTAMAAGVTTARLNHHQRWALLIVLGLLARSRRSRGVQNQELIAARAERKRLRKALDDMRQERDRERKRAYQAERNLRRSERRGRPGCGKIPLGTAAEAQMYLELRCAATGEHHSDYVTYSCEQGCEPVGSMVGVWHLAHSATRSQRERQAEIHKFRSTDTVEQEARLTDYDVAADLLGLTEPQAAFDDVPGLREWETRWAEMSPEDQRREIHMMDEHVHAGTHSQQRSVGHPFPAQPTTAPGRLLHCGAPTTAQIQEP